MTKENQYRAVIGYACFTLGAVANMMLSDSTVDNMKELFADELKAYQIDLVNRDELVHLSRGEMAIKVEKLTLSGSYLMNYGVTLPWQFPNAMWVLKGRRL